MQLLTAIILVLAISTTHALSKNNFRVSGIIDFVTFTKPRVGAIWIENFFKNGGKLGEFIRKGDNYLKTVQVTGQISIELPGGRTETIATFDGEYIHFAQPLYFAFDYEGNSLNIAPKFKINCDLEVTGSPGKYVCDGSEKYQSQLAPTPSAPSSESAQSHLSNTIRNQLSQIKIKLPNISSMTLDEILNLVDTGMNLYGYAKLHKSKEGYQDMKQSIKSLVHLAKRIGIVGELLESLLSIILYFISSLGDIEDEMFDITGAFLINLNTQKISDDSSEQQQPYLIEGSWKTSKADDGLNKFVEGFGQIYLMPESIVFNVADFAESIGYPLNDTSLVGDLELPFLRGSAYPLFQLRRWIEAKNEYQFDWQLNHKFSAIIGSNTPNKYVVFVNMWDSDGDGGLDFDDCIGKGNALGLETVDVSSGSYKFSQCDNDDDVHMSFSKESDPQKDEGTDLIWYKLSGEFTYYTWDGSGSYYEPFGHLYFKIGSRSINQKFIVWDIPRDQSSSILNKKSQTTPFSIYFRESKDFMKSGEKITPIGFVTENDGNNADDPIGSFDGHEWQVAAMIEGEDYGHNFTATDAWVKIKLQLTSIGTLNEPVPENVDYQLAVKLEMWCDDDGGSGYEAYGDLKVNIGLRDENQMIQLWHRKEGSENIKETLGTVHTETAVHNFKESPDFIDESQTLSKVVTLGSVMEDDATGKNNVIGNYNGYKFKPSDLVGNTEATTFQQDKDDWVKLTLTITPITTPRSILHEFVLEGTFYMIEKEDSGTNYEAYGYLDVDIGNRMSNRNRGMWRRQPSNHLSIKKGTGHTVKLDDVRFYERSGFLKETSTQTLLVHGYVKEDDNNGQDKYIGNYEGISLNTYELARPQGITRTFYSPDGSGGRVILKLKIRNLTEERDVTEAKSTKKKKAVPKTEL